ncbi:hypothetical protein [Streptomyces sp. S1D4-20]|uniref:hypothetical protein n=1 Tax=Streptomyces sp. S1D4-20 TaxID=2594462 RepID=UPI0013E0C77C|nr:hypothetical protein [Streptomyces sp. S1D4-20]
MADTGDALDVLADHLAADDGQRATVAAWEICGLGERLADAVAWQSGVDAVQAMAAAQSCREARRYLPPPVSGQPVPTPRAAPDAMERCARLLGLVARILQTPGGVRIQPDAGARQAATAHAARAQQALSGARQTMP